jgi:hypothetical protein
MGQLSSPPISAKQRARLHVVQLDDADQAVLIRELSQFKGILESPVPPLKAWALTTPPLAKPSLDDIAQSTVDRLRSAMSPAGFQRLEDHVRDQKRHMKIVPFPDMTGHSH